MLLLWVTDGKPRYRGDEASVVFISDVGAVHKVGHIQGSTDYRRSSSVSVVSLLLVTYLPFSPNDG